MKFIQCLVLCLCLCCLLARGAKGQETITFSDGSECGKAGMATSGAGKKYTPLKNRIKRPKEVEIDSDVALLAHVLTKERKVPSGDMDKARTRKQRYEKEPAKHRAEIELAEKL